MEEQEQKNEEIQEETQSPAVEQPEQPVQATAPEAAPQAPATQAPATVEQTPATDGVPKAPATQEVAAEGQETKPETEETTQ